MEFEVRDFNFILDCLGYRVIFEVGMFFFQVKFLREGIIIGSL